MGGCPRPSGASPALLIFPKLLAILSPMKVRIVLAIAGIVAFDQLSKALAFRFLEPSRPVEILEGFFRLTLTFNDGGAFGLFQGFGSWITILATGVSVGIVAILLGGPPQRPSMTWGLIGIAGGALGNLTDRLIHGAVIDFLEFRWHQLSWPVFNLADTAIVIGTGLVLFTLLTYERSRGAHELK